MSLILSEQVKLAPSSKKEEQQVMEALNRMVQVTGVNKLQAVNSFIACDGDVEMAINLLLENLALGGIEARGKGV